MSSLTPEDDRNARRAPSPVPVDARRFLPAFLRERIGERSHLWTVTANFGWLLGDKILRMAGGILLAIWLARYLGANAFGTYNYAIAFVALFTPIASLGLNEIVVRDLVRHRDTEGLTLGTAAMLALFGGGVAFVSCLIAFHLFGTGSAVMGALIALLGTTLLFKASEVVKYWYQSRTASRQTVWIESGVFAVFCAIKLAMIALHAPLTAFIVAMVAEAAVSAIGLVLLYTVRTGAHRQWTFRLSRARELLGDSLPIVLSGGFVLLNMNIDKVMLGRMSGATEVGLFSAASRLTEAWYFLPVIVGASIAPRLTQLFAQDRKAYERNAQSAFNLLSVAALLVCGLATALSGPVVRLLYGEAYAAAGPMLVVHVWSALFVFHVSLRTQLLVIEGKRMLILAFSFLTLFANVAINAFAIPLAGGLGASYASLASWALCVLVFPLAFGASRRYPLQFFFHLPRGARDHA